MNIRNITKILAVCLIVAAFFVNANLAHAVDKPTINDRIETAANVYYSSSNGLFQNGALMYRPKDTEILRLFDLTKSTMILFQFGEPRNCIEIIIGSTDGIISSGCIPVTPKQQVHDLINPPKEESE